MKVDARGKPYISQQHAAGRLGIDKGMLSRMAAEHPLYAPAWRGIPGSALLGRRLTRYHVDQVRLIESVLLGDMELDRAYAEWLKIRRALGYGDELSRRMAS